MQVLSNARRLTRILKPQILLNSAPSDHKLIIYSQCNSLHSSSSCSLPSSGNYCFATVRDVMYSRTSKGSFCSASGGESTATEAVKKIYDDIIDSVNVRRTMAPNAWLWSLIENCKTREDIKLLFDALQNLRIFRLSNLRIHDNFNCNLCREVTKACARVGAVDFGKKALWKHNMYGLTPSIASANHLLSYAKHHNDVELMVDVMKLLEKNHIPLQPSTADLVSSICYYSDNWELISKYSKKFLKAGVKLRRFAFDLWMDFAAKRGDTESLWKTEKLRSGLMKQHTLVSAFSCAKGLILEGKPLDAAAIIQLLDQTLPDTKKSGMVVELQKLVNEWPLSVVKHQKEENRKALAAVLKSCIPAMVNGLPNMGVEVNVNLEDLAIKEEIPC
ncbi:ADENYLYL CYCLASE [Salix purpurea]|uniref:ADENYLYL CYCLASE n=1 Tax=Salix purpurea TaxID=77065 RepID=A0A9Q0Z8P6_SALPP|nr:ADENYLYL CYCLASE [Salix purpurea]